MSQFKITMEQLKEAYERYQKNELIPDIAKSMGMHQSTLRKGFLRNDMPLRRHKVYKGVVTSDNSTKPLIEKNRSRLDPDNKRLCATCKRRGACKTGSKRRLGCYFVENKPNYEPDRSIFGRRNNDYYD